MSLNGKLEGFSLLDILQWAYQGKETGILEVDSKIGKGTLGFIKGNIVYAHHPDSKIQIGTILVRLNLISGDDLRKALAEQKESPKRQPLLATLVHTNFLKREDAWKALEQLIEETIDEMVTWSEGSFEFRSSDLPFEDDYRFYPEDQSFTLRINEQLHMLSALKQKPLVKSSHE